METTSYPTMEYSLSDIQLPDPPKEKDKTGVTLNKSSKGVNSSSKSEKNHAPKSEGQTNVTSNSINEGSNNNSQKICDPESPQTCVTSEDSKKEDLESETNVSEELKNSLKEVNRVKSKETSPTVDKSPEVQEVNSKNSVNNEVAISEGNCDAANDTKQGDDKVDSKKSSNSTLSSSSSSKMKEQRSKSKKRDSADSAAKERDSHNSQNTDRDDSAVDKESAKIVRKRKNRRTSRSSSRSSSSESSSSNGSSPERESSRSKKSGKSGSSSEGIASPSSSGSSSGSESEDKKKSPLKEKLKAGKTDGVEGSEGVVKQRRKINRNLSIKGFQEIAVAKDIELEDAQQPSTTSSHKVKKEDIEKNDEPSKKTEVREIKFTPRKLSLTSLKSGEKLEGQDSEKSNSKLGAKKRKWGNCTAALPKASVSISSDSLKTLIPDLKPFTVAPVLSDQDDLSNPVDMEPPPKKEPKIVNLPVHEEMVVEEVPTHSQTDKTSVVTDTKDLPNESAQVSPAHNPMSSIIFIKNLVRPFTLLQLKELLKQTGTMIDERFWIDKIKSKCIVVYETEEQAVATRNALHGTRWPLSNPKILFVDFSTEEELDAHRNMTEYPKPTKVTLHALEKQEIKEPQTIDIPKRKNREEHRRDKDRQKLPVTHVREWDKDKLTQDSPDQASHRTDKDTEKSRSDKRKEKKDSKRRVDDDAPAKLLDDLFRKTRASPCIYWLPLTEEQAKQREEERQARRMEREKRWQQRKEQEESERRNRAKAHSGREKENRRSQSRSRSPQARRR